MKDLDLDRLIEGITSDNLHDEVSFGAPVGKEILESRYFDGKERFEFQGNYRK
ncbi:MAG: hypothetical protein WCZ98_04415 [Sideroxydans sp.]